MPRWTALAIGLATWLSASAAAPAADTSPPPEGAVLIVFPFASPDDGKTGRTFTDNLRLRAARLGLVVVDDFSLKEAMAGLPMPGSETPAADVARILKDRVGARLALWGEVRRQGDALTMDVRGIDLDPPADARGQKAEPLVLQKTYRAAEPQLVGPTQDDILADLSGLRKAPVPVATPEADALVPTVGPELVPNGGFETGGKSPDGWQRIDGLTTFWTDEGQTGKGIQINTDVDEGQWRQWQERFKAGAGADEAPRPIPTVEPKYNTVAASYGVAYDSDPIPVRSGKAYKVSLNYRGPGGEFFFPKLFIRGYGKVEGEMRVVYDAYLALRSKTGGKAWEWNVRIVEIPTDPVAPVEFVRLKLYAYWPPATYLFDNVSMKEVAPGAAIPQ